MLKRAKLVKRTGGPDIVDLAPIEPETERSVTSPWWKAWGIAVAVLVLWQLGWAVDIIPPIGMPSPLEIAIALWQLVSSGELWIHLEATLPRLGIGWIVGAVLAILAGRASHHLPPVRSIVAAVAAAIGSVPAIALLPLFMIWLGAGEASMIATTALAAFGPGLRAVPVEAYGIGNRPVLHGVEALRASLPLAIAVLVALEMINGGFGLGALIFSAAELYRSDQIVAGCLVLAAIGLGVPALLGLIDRDPAHERHESRESR